MPRVQNRDAPDLRVNLAENRRSIAMISVVMVYISWLFAIIINGDCADLPAAAHWRRNAGIPMCGSRSTLLIEAAMLKSHRLAPWTLGNPLGARLLMKLSAEVKAEAKHARKTFGWL